MPTKRVDRRLQRTRALLQEALMAMILEKGYEATTVQDIIDRANVGRSTFYAHFADKETLLVSRLEDLRNLLKQQQIRALKESGGSPDGGFGISLAMLEHARGHWQLYQSMIGKRSGSVVLQRVHDMIAQLVRDGLTAHGVKSATVQRDLVAQHVTGAFMGILTWWLDHAPKLAPQQVDAIFRRLVMQGLAAELGQRGRTA
jgi:AcrR family transcriptional regulator